MRPDDYPIPGYASHIWIAGDQIHLVFPPTLERDRYSSVQFPNTEKGLALLLDVLRRRKSELHIGTKGTPTRYQVERTLAGDKRYNEWLKAMQTSDKEREESIAFLAELGL